MKTRFNNYWRMGVVLGVTLSTLMVAVIFGWEGQAVLAQHRYEQIDDALEPQSGPLSDTDQADLLRQAAREAFEPYVPAGSEFTVGQIKIVEGWAFLNFRLTSNEPAKMKAAWELRLALGHWDGQVWAIALEGSDDFSRWLPQLPKELISSEARSYLDPQISIASDAPGLRLPFPAGQTWKYLAGPNGSPVREAVDFGPFRELEEPDPAPEPIFTGRERTVTAAASGVVIDKDANLLILRHAGDPTWETGYFSLAAASNINRLGQFVAQGETIGLASRETDPTGEVRVHFWLRRVSLDQVIDGQVLSEWRIHRDNGFAAGQGAGRIVYKDGTEKIDCRTVERFRLDSSACHVKHFTVAPDPLPPATVRLSPTSTITIPLQSTEDIRVLVNEAENLSRIRLRLSYSPVEPVTVLDAFPDIDGVQVAPGNIFVNTPVTFIQNTVNLEQGTVHFEAELQSPASAFTGNDSLLEIDWQRQMAGTVQVTVEEVSFADSNGRALPVIFTADPVTIQSGFVLQGQVELQGRTDAGGVLLTTAGHQQQTTSDGYFKIGVGQSYQLDLTTQGYLSSRAEGRPAELGFSEADMVDLGRIVLLGGEVTGDDRIDIFDLAFIGSRFGGDDVEADVNGDGTIDIFDLALAATNYGRQGPIIE